MIKFNIESMTCSGCGAAITRAIQAADGSARVNTFPTTHLVEVESTLTPDQLLTVLAEAGYPAEIR